MRARKRARETRKRPHISGVPFCTNIHAHRTLTQSAPHTDTVGTCFWVGKARGGVVVGWWGLLEGGVIRGGVARGGVVVGASHADGAEGAAETARE